MLPLISILALLSLSLSLSLPLSILDRGNMQSMMASRCLRVGSRTKAAARALTSTTSATTYPRLDGITAMDTIAVEAPADEVHFVTKEALNAKMQGNP